MRHIIIVEDNDTDAYLLQRHLCKLGFVTSVCTNAYQLAEYIMTGVIDVIVTDLSLPGINGIDIIKRTRRIEKNVPLVVVSAQDSYMMEQECIEAGATAYVQKPFTQQAIFDTFSRYL